MKKLALGIGLGAFIVFGASAGALAAYKSDNTAGVASIRDSRVDGQSATSRRLLFINESLYGETTAVETSAASPGAHGNQERADMAEPYTAVVTQTDTRLLFIDESLYSETTVEVNEDNAVTASPGAFGNQERIDTAQPDWSAETQRMLCDGDICFQ